MLTRNLFLASLSVFLLGARILPAQEIDLDQILQESRTSHRALLPEQRRFLADEEIRQYRTRKGERKLTSSKKYEVLQTEKGPLYKLVEKNGKRIAMLEDADPRILPAVFQNVDFKSQKRTWSVGSDGFFQHREYRLLRSESLRGRKMLVIEGKLKADEAKLRKHWFSSFSDMTVWLDPETKWILRYEYRVVRPSGRATLGTVMTIDFDTQQGLPLQARIWVSRPASNGKVLYETEQIYTNYRKFNVESSITMEEEAR